MAINQKKNSRSRYRLEKRKTRRRKVKTQELDGAGEEGQEDDEERVFLVI